ncbi:MAG: 16S rRNA U1498 N3-methylase RsmE, partial [Paraglaciecola sp.]
MRICRIYHPHIIPVDQVLELTDDACHHVANVLR